MLAITTAKRPLHIVLADDDDDDQEFFVEAVSVVAPHVKVEIANDGEELMELLLNKKTLPDIIFLDLNMPRKNGHICLKEIRANKKMLHIPIVIYSTSSNSEQIDSTFKAGANLYIPKPESFGDLKLIAKKIFSLNWEDSVTPDKNNFVLSAKNLA